MTSTDAIMNRVIDRMGSVPDCEVIQVAESGVYEQDIPRYVAFCRNLPIWQRWMACQGCGRVDGRCASRDHYYCPTADRNVTCPDGCPTRDDYEMAHGVH